MSWDNDCRKKDFLMGIKNFSNVEQVVGQWGRGLKFVKWI